MDKDREQVKQTVESEATMATALLLHTTPNFLSPISPTRIPRLHRRHLHRYCTKKPKKPLSSSFRNGGPAETECPVPLEQQPINEYQNLSTSFPFSWASGDLLEYCSPDRHRRLLRALRGPPRRFLRRLRGPIGAAEAVSLRCFQWLLGGHSRRREDVPRLGLHEETGWYDGQIWVKTAEVLARDRLLGSFSVKPLLSRLKVTLVTLAASILACVVVLLYIDGGQIQEAENRVIRGVYNDDSARSFEPDAFCGGDPAPPQ
ncbi:hypothetical protein ACLB2K_014749 [Fragaria x ananassa]